MYTANKRQEFAKKAFEYVKEVKNEHKDVEGKYLSYVKKFPVMIKTNGLLAALSFEYAKSNGDNWKENGGEKKAHGLLLNHIARFWGYENDESSNFQLIKDMVKWDSLTVIRKTDEIINLLNWMRRFAEGMLKEEKKNDS